MSHSSPPKKYDFDQDFQNQIAAHTIFNQEFLKRAYALVRAEHFDNIGHQILTQIALDLFHRYKVLPPYTILAKEVVDRVKSKEIRPEFQSEVVATLRELKDLDISKTRKYVQDQIVEFVRNQEMEAAVIKAAELIEAGEHEKAALVVNKASKIGLAELSDAYDFWDSIGERTEYREDIASGRIEPSGVSTGIARLDQKLIHKGWGKKELTMFAGFAKAGKSTALLQFAKNACLNGHNVLIVTLEVSREIYSARFDANISKTEVLRLAEGSNPELVEKQITSARSRAGKLIIHEYPTKSLTVSQFERVLENHSANGLNFDLVVIDYADLMSPDRYYRDDSIKENTSIIEGLRRLAVQFNVAMLTATQTNREGGKSQVAGMMHVAGNIEKARIADLLISINKTDAEKENNECRLHFAGSRNGEDGFSLKVKQDLSRMIFVDEVLGFV